MNSFKDSFLSYRFFYVLGALMLVFVVAGVYPSVFTIAKALALLFLLFILVDLFLLWKTKEGLMAKRTTPEKFSLGEDNPVLIDLESIYGFSLHCEVIDEIPVQFQRRDINWKIQIDPNSQTTLKYDLRPVKRGEYHFGTINVLCSTIIGLMKRRYRFEGHKMTKVYPSYIQLKKYRLAAISNRLKDIGIKKIRKIGTTSEFEQIKDYVQGDDPRKINWRATARMSKLMTNQYQDEKSQQVFCVIDKGRQMKMPFEGLSLLDYSVNASLVISHVAISKEDKAGLITFSNKISSMLAPSKRARQMHDILETLYNQRTLYKETNYELLYTMINRRVHQRSLILLFTNFEAVSSLRRQLKYFRAISRKHLLVVVFFVNTELKTIMHKIPETTEEIYQQAIAEKIAYDKQLIVNELKANGIQTILTEPKNLTINAINKYLELKARGAI